MKWKTKDGREIEISDMRTSHIQNVLNMLEKNGAISSSTLMSYLRGPAPNGEMAQDAYFNEVDEVLDRPVCREMDELESELEKRQ